MSQGNPIGVSISTEADAYLSGEPGSALRLQISSVNKRYGNVRALDEVNLQVRPGEVMALVGENGAGKSTLVKLLSGAIAIDGGSIYVDGREVSLGTTKRSHAAGIAVVQQEVSVLGNLSIAENVLLGRPGAPAFWLPRRIAREARPLLRKVGLGHLDPSAPAADLSIGDRQLIEIARVLGSDAHIIAFDEPTAALSDAEIARVLGLIRELAAEGRSIIYISHRLDEIFAVADRVTVLRNGRSSAPSSVADIEVRDLVTAMLGRELTQLFPERTALGETYLEIDQLTGTGLACPVSLTVRRGEIVGLIGQIGSGAAQALRALAGMSDGVAGQVRLDGAAVDLSSRTAGLTHGIAYCSDDRKSDGIFAELSVVRNLSSPWLTRIARAGIRSTSSERALATVACDAFGVDISRLDTAVGRLSGGNQQKIALGKWLGTSPRVLLVNEPTRGVDIGARAEIYARLRDLCATGLSIVLASSDTAEVLGLCDTVGAFFRGRLVDLRAHSNWTEAELLQAIVHRADSEVSA
ncbi:sugar ABC transporter ATP-binding protein [Jatrophihabitans sp. DSM 45814]